MYMPPDPLEVHPAGFIRRRCRNPRCGSKLKRQTDKPRDAFCCSGCFEQHYGKVCLVCERPMRPKAAQQRFCSNRCRSTFRRHPERFSSCLTPPCRVVADATRKALTSADSTGLKTRTKRDRPWRQIAGPQLSPRSFALATLPLDSETAARVRRANEQAAINTTPIAGAGWPIIEIGHANNPWKAKRKTT
jgi:hypothetical protein